MLCRNGRTSTLKSGLFLVYALVFFGSSQAQSVLLTDATYNRILALDITTGNIEELVVDNLGFPWRIFADASVGKMYWTNVDKNLIQQAALDGTEVETLAIVTYPQGIAVDNKKKYIYVAEAGTPQILRFNMQGGDETVLMDDHLLDPDDIHLDAEDQLLFWIDHGLGGIRRSTTLGEKRKTLTEGEVTAIAIDSGKKLIYWTNSKAGEVYRMNYIGQEIKRLFVSVGHTYSGLAIDDEGKNLFWVDMTDGVVQKLELKTGVISNYEIDLPGNFHYGITYWPSKK